MFVGVCRLRLHLAGNNSLKGKRRIVRSIVDRTRAKFNAAVAEVSDNDVLRQAVIGISVIGNSSAHVDSMLGRVSSFVEWLGLAPVVDIATEVISLGGELGLSAEGDIPMQDSGDTFEYDINSDMEEEW